jgi:hypothetical protein
LYPGSPLCGARTHCSSPADTPNRSITHEEEAHAEDQRTVRCTEPLQPTETRLNHTEEGVSTRNDHDLRVSKPKPSLACLGDELRRKSCEPGTANPAKSRPSLKRQSTLAPGLN